MAVIGILHPGQMGVSVAASTVAAGHDVIWAGDGRSVDTRARAESARLRDVGSIRAMVDQADLIISVVPPASALDVATAITEAGFSGRYVDANAVSPATANSIAAVQGDAGVTPVDGGIIGPPAWSEGSTRLYLAGDEAASTAELLAGGPLGVVALDTPFGSASALKMAYASWSKGSAALLLTVAAYAESAGVADKLFSEWDLSQPGVSNRSRGTASGVAPKAWRFVGEMDEIAASFDAAGLTPAFHSAAAETYRRMAGLKGSTTTTLDDVIATLLAP